MTENLISWNFTNWVTVVLMVALGFAVLALLSQGVRKVAAGNTAHA